MCKIDKLSERIVTRDGYTLTVRVSKSTRNRFSSRIHCTADLSRNGVDICSGWAVGPEDEDIVATGKVGVLEEEAVSKAIVQAERIKVALA